MTIPKNPRQLAPAYEPRLVEERIYESWNSAGHFQPILNNQKEPFVMIMPPPNVTGELHMGHALTFAIEDMIVRWHRMKGEPTLFLPGTDHAGIATQVVVERLLTSEGKTRHDLGRVEFEKRIWQWVDEYGGRIYEQLRRLGTSCDWSRESFTLDEGPREAVRKTFVDLYRKGLIYRGERITNWCPRCSTALSDLEVKYKDIDGALYEISYPIVDGSDDLVVTTTRPETMLGDTGVAVNPSDERYQHLIGKEVRLPLTERTITVVGDEAVEVEFGSGALKVTPGHDPVDFDIGLRHGLEVLSVIGDDAIMNQNAGDFAGLTRSDCRAKVISALEAQGRLLGSREFRHSVGHCDRCDEIIEPIVTKQWYVSMDPLAQPAREAVRTGKIRIIPSRFTNVYFDWMDNIRDWPVSRQLWWGHQIPVWYCSNCDGVIVDYSDPDACPECDSPQLIQEPDVLDTWFSSGLWTHSTLGWPDQTNDLTRFYPGSVMETGYDILFFWVARMIMLGIENMGTPPFHTVYLHGLVLDPEGVKMSKTKGNVLDPLELINEYGADAIRFALTTGTAAGNNVRMSEGRLESSRNFANKLWNSARFVLTVLERGGGADNWRNPDIIHLHDRWIISRLNTVTAEVNRHMENFQFGDAQREVHDFLWNEYCDWFIELAKIRIASGSEENPIPVLIFTLERTLRLLHPFMPFVTEEIWGILCESVETPDHWEEALIVAEYPVMRAEFDDTQSEDEMNLLFELIGAIRNIRAELRIKQNVKLNASMIAPEYYQLLEDHREIILKLAGIELNISEAVPGDANINSVTLVTTGVTSYIDMGEDGDMATEIVRLEEEKQEISRHAISLEKRLSNPGFIGNAPDDVIEKERDRLKRALERGERLDGILGKLS